MIKLVLTYTHIPIRLAPVQCVISCPICMYESTRGTKLPFLIYTQIRTLDFIFIIPLLFFARKILSQMKPSAPNCSISSCVAPHLSVCLVSYSASHSHSWHACTSVVFSHSHPLAPIVHIIFSHVHSFHASLSPCCLSLCLSLYISLYTSLLLVLPLALWAAGRSGGLSEEKHRFKWRAC